jgi:hypothetical protein
MNKVENSSDPFFRRRGSVYVAVLGTSLIVSVLALSVLALQRIENRMLAASSDVEQAKLNATAAIELGLLDIVQNADWRVTHTELEWFDSPRIIGAGNCQLEVDDADAEADDEYDGLSANDESPIRMVGIGRSGQAEQRVEVIVDPRRNPLASFRAAAAADPAGILQNESSFPWNSTLDPYRDDEGEEEEEGDRPTQLDIYSLPTRTPNLGRNVGFENGTTYWTGEPPGASTATISQATSFVHSGANSLRVTSRADWMAGAAQRIDDFVKPGQQYSISGWIYTEIVPGTYHISIYTKGSGGSVSINAGGATVVVPGVWTPINGTVTAASWSGTLEYAFVKFGGANVVAGNPTYYLDNIDVYETNARFIYRKVLAPDVNDLYVGAPTNSEGHYSIDCLNQKLVIERSRIHGTLAIFNPGSGSSIGAGPNYMSPAKPTEPVLLVEGNFAIRATNRVLSEAENGVDYNLDTIVPNHIYPSEIHGLVAVSGDLTFENSPKIQGELIVGGSVTGAVDVDYQPDLLLSPPPGFYNYRYDRRPGSARKAVIEQE